MRIEAISAVRTMPLRQAQPIRRGVQPVGKVTDATSQEADSPQEISPSGSTTPYQSAEKQSGGLSLAALAGKRIPIIKQRPASSTPSTGEAPRREGPAPASPEATSSAAAEEPAEEVNQDGEAPVSSPASERSPSGEELDQGEVQEIRSLERRDQEVRTHEQAHVSAGGGIVRGGAQFSYQTGPDGQRYAVGGEVSIDTSKESDPGATVRKMQAVRRAALAPANPSSQDRRVAAASHVSEVNAQRLLREEQGQAAAELRERHQPDQAEEPGTAAVPETPAPPAGTEPTAIAPPEAAAPGQVAPQPSPEAAPAPSAQDPQDQPIGPQQRPAAPPSPTRRAIDLVA